MAKNKTTETTRSVNDFIDAIADEIKIKDSYQLIDLIKEQTGLEPKMWGASIIGFGSYHYKYDSGHEGDSCLIGFSPRANAISLYFYLDPEKRESHLQKLGKYKASKGCIYIKKLADIDVEALKTMIKDSIEYMKKKHG